MQPEDRCLLDQWLNKTHQETNLRQFVWSKTRSWRTQKVFLVQLRQKSQALGSYVSRHPITKRNSVIIALKSNIVPNTCNVVERVGSHSLAFGKSCRTLKV